MFLETFLVSELIYRLVTTPKALMDSLHAIGARIQSSSGTGVMVSFEKIADKNSRPELSQSESKPWHQTKSMIYVRQNYKTGNFTGFWPIPESFWPDPNEAQCPPRKATPTLKFSCQGMKQVFGIRFYILFRYPSKVPIEFCL